MHFGRGDNIGPNRSSSMGMSAADIPGTNFHPQMGNMQRGGPGNMMPNNHMSQMNFMNQQRMNMNQQMAQSQMNQQQQPAQQQMSQQQQMHQMQQQHQRMLNHQRMMMMNAAHHNNSQQLAQQTLMRPSGPNMSKTQFLTFYIYQGSYFLYNFNVPFRVAICCNNVCFYRDEHGSSGRANVWYEQQPEPEASSSISKPNVYAIKTFAATKLSISSIWEYGKLYFSFH